MGFLKIFYKFAQVFFIKLYCDRLWGPTFLDRLPRTPEEKGDRKLLRRRFSSEFKKKVAQALREQDTVQRIASRHKVHPKGERMEAASGGGAVQISRSVASAGPFRDLHAKIGEITVERARFGEMSRAERVYGRGGRKLAGVSRSSLYYRPAGESAENLALALDEVHLKCPGFSHGTCVRRLMRLMRHRNCRCRRH